MTNINLKHILNRLFELRGYVEDIYRSVKMQLGEDANYIREWCDLRRVEYESETAKELEGDALFEDLLKVLWKTGKDYVWHYKGQRFRVTPFRSTYPADGGFIFYFGEQHSLVNFASITRDAVDTECSIWEAIIARLYGIADGHASAKKLMHVCAEMPAPDAEVAEDLKWKDGYSVDPAEAVKVPEGADGTLACADPCPEEVPVPEPAPAEPVVEQAEEPVPKPKPNWKEKRAKEKDLIRAGGGPLPDGNVDMTDEEKEEYRRWKEKRLAEEDPKWKQSVESPQRYG